MGQDNSIIKKNPFKNSKIHRFEVAVCHGQGGRKYQEDSYAYLSRGSKTHFTAIVADGMGGLEGGKEISQFVADKLLEATNSISLNKNIYDQLSALVLQLNQEAIARNIPGGSTLACIYCNPKGLYWCCVGDSRVYLYRDGFLNHLNEDGDYINQLFVHVLKGEMPIKSAFLDAQKDSLVSYMGFRGNLIVDGNRRPLQMQSGDKILICSDGVYNYIPKVEMNKMLELPPIETAVSMEDYIRGLGHPHQDNYTAVVIDFV